MYRRACAFILVLAQPCTTTTYFSVSQDLLLHPVRLPRLLATLRNTGDERCVPSRFPPSFSHDRFVLRAMVGEPDSSRQAHAHSCLLAVGCMAMVGPPSSHEKQKQSFDPS